ncbi:cyclic GMP-AMP synthase DncV-like nucleotidyltransferase [Brevibacillus sp. NPDC003359]|uniref:cyclic GMP-AMP synthase DncV-like nucleotidyltransferase n=1 Tax=unclassified Brevibacillus TaxID=2684853 RepID=UPI0036A10131
MSNCHDLFTTFHNEIYLDSSKKESLRTSRNAIRNKIKKYFKDDLKVKEPKFYGQGSYMMNTTVTPIDGEYDIDDGLYLEHLTDVAEEEWPKTATVHRWVVDAVTGHTDTPPVDKNTCVRVIYKAEYHVDIPIYVKKKDEHPKLAHKTEGWIDSDPKELTKWFNDEVAAKGDQLKRAVRYFKAWKDKKEGETKLPSGMILTILAANYFVSDHPNNDDEAFIATAKAIHDSLSESFSLTRPVFPSEELISDWSETKQNNFLTKLENLVKKGGEALEEQDKTKASKKWSTLFGDRFPEYTPPEETETEKNSVFKSSAPAVLGNHGRSA